ncbi:MAG: O-antigen ligase family protein [Halioglobus sp.]|nr:O-antigen ligase family protein [Halioglobus sp.]
MKNTKLTSSDHLRRAFPFLLLAVYGVFLCSYFIFNDYSKPYQFYARVVFIPSLFVVVGSIRDVWKRPLFQMILAYILYLLLSGFWSDPLDWYRLGQKATIAVNLISFIAVTYFLVQWNRSFFEYMLQACALFAAAAAVISIVIFYGDNPFPTARLTPIGSLTNINESSNVYSVFALLAAFFVMRFPGRRLNWVLLLSIGAFICVAWFGQSRTAFTALIIALLTLLSLMQKNKRLLCLAALTALTGLLFLAFPEVVDQLFERGSGLRPLIWAAIWNEAQSAPVFGHGLASTLSVGISGYTFETAHNAFLMLFWQGGTVGVVIFLVLLVVAFCHAWSWGQQQGDFSIFCILIFAVCTMMTGVDTLIERPRDQWMLFWFPLALLLSYQSGTSRTRLHTARPASSLTGV